jgi:hypothetical protein
VPHAYLLPPACLPLGEIGFMCEPLCLKTNAIRISYDLYETTQTDDNLSDVEKGFLDAVNNGTLEDVKRLLESVNVNVKGINEWSPIICVGHTGRVDVLELLLDKKRAGAVVELS